MWDSVSFLRSSVYIIEAVIIFCVGRETDFLYSLYWTCSIYCFLHSWSWIWNSLSVVFDPDMKQNVYAWSTGHEAKFCSLKNRHGEDLLWDESYISYCAKPERSILSSHQIGHKRIVLYIIILLCWPQVCFQRNNGTFDHSGSSACLLYLESSLKAVVADYNYDNL